MPTVSILMPSNRPGFLHQAMGSVFDQTYKDYQLLVGYCEQWWPTKINELAQAAVGEYVCVLCDDDLLALTYLEQTVAEVKRGADVVYTNWGRLKDQEVREWKAEPWTFESFKSGGCNPLCGATYLIRRELWREIGGIDPDQLFWDWATAYACFKAGAKAAWVEEPLAIYREHEHHTPVDNREAMRLLHQKYPELRSAA